MLSPCSLLNAAIDIVTRNSYGEILLTVGFCGSGMLVDWLVAEWNVKMRDSLDEETPVLSSGLIGYHRKEVLKGGKGREEKIDV